MPNHSGARQPRPKEHYGAISEPKKMDGIKFRRQQPIENYIVDFISFEKRLVIELDGGQHAQHKEKEKDIQRDRFMVENGFKVLRFWNNEVLSTIDSVLEVIRMECLK